MVRNTFPKSIRKHAGGAQVMKAWMNLNGGQRDRVADPARGGSKAVLPPRENQNREVPAIGTTPRMISTTSRSCCPPNLGGQSPRFNSFTPGSDQCSMFNSQSGN